MITCKVCGNPVSRDAQACPKCGEPPPIAKFSNSIFGTIFGMAAFFAIVFAVMWALGVLR